MSKSEMEKMHTCELYLPGDEDIAREQIKCLDRLYDFNMTRPTEMVKRQQMLKEMFEEIGDNCYIEPPQTGAESLCILEITYMPTST